MIFKLSSRFILKSTSLLRQLHTSRQPLLAGHSKWANIKHIKAEKDGEKSALFTRFSRQIRLAIQEGGSPDPKLNTLLRNVVDVALSKNMPMASIQNSIKKSQQNKAEIKKYILEMKYKQKVFLICVLYTENFAGRKMDLMPIMKKFGTIYCDVAHLFDNFGLIEANFEKSSLQPNVSLEERVTEDAIECGAEDVEVINQNDGEVNFVCNPIELTSVSNALQAKGYKIGNTEHIYAAKNLIQVTPDELKSYQGFLNKLREMPGVEDFYDNISYEEHNTS